ncbi:uncharacterized protein LOC143018515 isoform X2 [Oratosquilla oratoria]
MKKYEEEGTNPSKEEKGTDVSSSEVATETKVEQKYKADTSGESFGAKFKYKMGMKTEEEEDKTGWTKVDEVSPSKDKAPGSEPEFKYTMGVKTEREEDKTGWNKVEDVSPSKDTVPDSNVNFKYVMGVKTEEERNKEGWKKVKEIDMLKNQLPSGNVSFLYRMGMKSEEELKAEADWTPVSEFVGSDDEEEEESLPSQSGDQDKEHEEKDKNEDISKGLDQVNLEDSGDRKKDDADDDNVFVQWAMNTDLSPDFLRKKYSGLSVKKKKEVEKVLSKARTRRMSCPSYSTGRFLPSIAEKPHQQGSKDSSDHDVPDHRGPGRREAQATRGGKLPGTSKTNQNESESLVRRRKGWFTYLMSEKIEEARIGEFYDPALEEFRHRQSSLPKDYKMQGRRHTHYDIIDGIPSPRQGDSRSHTQDRLSYLRSFSDQGVPSQRQPSEMPDKTSPCQPQNRQRRHSSFEGKEQRMYLDHKNAKLNF